MLKSVEDLVPAVARRFDRTWPDVACGLGEDAWPHAFALGRPSQAELAHRAGEVVAEVDALRLWSKHNGLVLETEPRRMGVVQELPVRVVVPTADAAAEVVGNAARERLARARRRARQLGKAFPSLGAEDLCVVVRRIDAWEDLDVELLVTASQWFATHDARGMTPRQVPLEGFHAKWLDAAGRRALVCLLAGKEDLGLVARPRELALAYVDPTYLQHCGRRYDVCVEGDTWRPAYEPHVVVIVENKDSYLWFPPVEGGICVFGSGRLGPAVCAACDWITEAPRLFYWGDMDADGLEILHTYRAARLAVESILMDVEAFGRYERYGTRMAAGKRGLDEHVQVETPLLTTGEQALYDLLCDRSWQGALRIEQERIPLQAARDELLRKLGT